MRYLAAIVATLLGGSAALVLSAMLHLDTRLGRRALGDLLEAWIGGEIRGDLRIGHVDDVGRDRIVARDVLFTSPSGEPALRLDQVVLDPAPSRFLFEHTIAVRSAYVRGARLWMVDRGDGLRVERALDSIPRPSDGAPSVFLDFDGILFEGLDSEWRLGDAPPFEIDHASGLMRVRTDSRGNVVLRLDRITGRAEFDLPLFDVSAGVRHASGRVHAGYRRMGAFDVELDVAGSPLELALELDDAPDGLRVRAETGARGPSTAWLAALGIDLATELSGEFPGDVDLAGAVGTERPERGRGDPQR